MKHLTFILVFSLFFVSNLSAQSVLKAGTQVPVKLTLDADSKIKEPPTAIVAEDVFSSDGTIAIKHGTSVQLYYDNDRARACGAPGYFTLRFETTRAVNNMKVALDCDNIVRRGKDKHGLSIGLGLGLGSFVWPCLACLLIKGQNVCIPAGTVIPDVYVAEDVSI